MGQKIRPTGLRLGITETHRSRWYARKRDYGKLLVEDQKIRRHIRNAQGFNGVSRIDIERKREEVRVILHCSRPGAIIGKKGSKVEGLKADIEKEIGRPLQPIDIQEVKEPDLDAQLVAEGMAAQLRRRTGYRRAIKRMVEQTMQAGAKGCKIQISGRLGGSEMCRVEVQSMGSIPLSTLSAVIDYGFAESYTTSGVIGAKAWIYKGRVLPGETEVTDGPDA